MFVNQSINQSNYSEARKEKKRKKVVLRKYN